MEDLQTQLQALTESLGLPNLTSFLADHFKESLAELQEVDTTLTEIGKTANLTSAELEELGDTSFAVAAKFGTSANDYLANVQEMTNAGYKNASQMAELLTMVQSATNLQSDLAANYLLAADNAYNYAGNIEKLTAYLDGINQITRENTLNMEEMANATITASSILTDLPSIPENELAALLGTGLANTKASGEEVALAIKDILTNLNELNSIAPPIQSLQELADVYNSLPDDNTKKLDILSDIGGTEHADVLAGILSNWNQYEKMLGDFENSSGSMMNDAAASANTLQGALNTLASTWTDTVGNIADSDGLTTAVQALTTLLGGINNVTDTFDGLGTIGLISGGILSSKNAGGHKLFCPNLICLQ